MNNNDRYYVISTFGITRKQQDELRKRINDVINEFKEENDITIFVDEAIIVDYVDVDDFKNFNISIPVSELRRKWWKNDVSVREFLEELENEGCEDDD